jgi:hypothetical protein
VTLYLKATAPDGSDCSLRVKRALVGSGAKSETYIAPGLGSEAGYLTSGPGQAAPNGYGCGKESWRVVSQASVSWTTCSNATDLRFSEPHESSSMGSYAILHCTTHAMEVVTSCHSRPVSRPLEQWWHPSCSSSILLPALHSSMHCLLSLTPALHMALQQLSQEMLHDVLLPLGIHTLVFLMYLTRVPHVSYSLPCPALIYALSLSVPPCPSYNSAPTTARAS